MTKFEKTLLAFTTFIVLLWNIDGKDILRGGLFFRNLGKVMFTRDDIDNSVIAFVFDLNGIKMPNIDIDQRVTDKEIVLKVKEIQEAIIDPTNKLVDELEKIISDMNRWNPFIPKDIQRFTKIERALKNEIKMIYKDYNVNDDERFHEIFINDIFDVDASLGLLYKHILSNVSSLIKVKNMTLDDLDPLFPLIHSGSLIIKTFITDFSQMLLDGKMSPKLVPYDALYSKLIEISKEYDLIYSNSTISYKDLWFYYSYSSVYSKNLGNGKVGFIICIPEGVYAKVNFSLYKAEPIWLMSKYNNKTRGKVRINNRYLIVSDDDDDVKYLELFNLETCQKTKFFYLCRMESAMRKYSAEYDDELTCLSSNFFNNHSQVKQICQFDISSNVKSPSIDVIKSSDGWFLTRSHHHYNDKINLTYQYLNTTRYADIKLNKNNNFKIYNGGEGYATLNNIYEIHYVYNSNKVPDFVMYKSKVSSLEDLYKFEKEEFTDSQKEEIYQYIILILVLINFLIQLFHLILILKQRAKNKNSTMASKKNGGIFSSSSSSSSSSLTKIPRREKKQPQQNKRKGLLLSLGKKDDGNPKDNKKLLFQQKQQLDDTNIGEKSSSSSTDFRSFQLPPPPPQLLLPPSSLLSSSLPPPPLPPLHIVNNEFTRYSSEPHNISSSSSGSYCNDIDNKISSLSSSFIKSNYSTQKKTNNNNNYYDDDGYMQIPYNNFPKHITPPPSPSPSPPPPPPPPP